ncbi:AAA-like domain-containing protein [Leptolyngbya sp. CCNP1308]|uniref:AAA-like domain-containing protein n=1 Tax=Leptolyngbya sp. CCNP1308 TaxID=3110255 RepID=UPI002B20FDD0|nr:AAA-like domain-containing protein [Leptolyngbya sp. CCNP1308]MEA5448364.1 AAA-like domain-containing protein [Leptolyngbya sp. CCNP1308]
MSAAPSTFYKVGGALPQNVPSYVTRGSDRDLYEALKAGEFCYVLNSRQMGKTSLMVRTLAKLQANGWAGIIIDFSSKDSQVDKPDQWYDGIINQLNRQFDLLDRPAFRGWLKERDFIAPVERLAEFIETVLLPSHERPIVVFIDEIDSTLGLPFTDDFFALIRACYNKRAENLDYERLTFALLGVAAPSELIGDAKRTPFNIGESIDLKGFEFEEALPLATGLTGKAERPEEVLREILHWTGGQPFLTQRLCQLVADSDAEISAHNEMTRVQHLVESRLIENWESQDHQEHLKTIRKRLLDDEQKAGYLLELYRAIRQAGNLPAENQPEERELQLSGLVVKRDNQLRVYNPIYVAVFDEDWINTELQKLRPYSESFRAWVVSGKTDSSRLLRGGALVEAERWAGEKATRSAEDREFLAASRAQQREEEIAAKEREAELAREKQGREAAEAAEQIQAEANRQAQRKIRRGSFVLGGALAAAVVLGGLAWGAVGQLRAANQQREEAENLAKTAQQELTQIQQEKEQVAQDLTQANDKVAKANKELAQRQETLNTVEAQRQVVYDQLKKTEQQAKGQQGLLAQLKQDLANADAAVDQAKQAEQEAQRNADQAASDLFVAQKALAEVAQEQQEIAALNDTTKALSGLIRDLYIIEKPEAARDAIEQIGLSFTDFTEDKTELKQVLLNSSLALAHLNLISADNTNERAQERINEAQMQIKQSVRLVEANPNIFNASASGRAIAFFTYAVQGNLREEQDYFLGEQELPNADLFYEQAFSYVSETPSFNQDITQGTVGESFRQLLAPSSTESFGDQFQALVIASLKKHYDFRARQSIRELDLVLAQYQWQKADDLTNHVLIASALSKDLNISAANIACPILREIDTLWIKHSAGHFGFRVQREIYEKTGNALDFRVQGDIHEETGNALESSNEVSWIKFAYEVGWNRISGDIEEILRTRESELGEQIEWLSYRELLWSEGMNGRELQASNVPIGHLPFLLADSSKPGFVRLRFSQCRL